MGWKGTINSMVAAQRRYARAARRQQNDLVRQQKHAEKLEGLEKATYEAEVYENRIDLIKSIHKECSNQWEWEEIAITEPPAIPTNEHHHEKLAQAVLDAYKPTVLDKLLRREERKRDEFESQLTFAKEKDIRDHDAAMNVYRQEMSEWESITDLAKRILTGDEAAFLEALHRIAPFDEISGLGSSLHFRISDQSRIEITLQVNGEEVIPREVKTLLKSGKLSVKEMPKSKFWELYQDYICGCVLRIARELYALLPLNMAIVTALGNVLNTYTGHLDECPILSVVIPRSTLDHLIFDSLDPSDAMKIFVHRMSFKKTSGFSAIEKFTFDDTPSVMP